MYNPKFIYRMREFAIDLLMSQTADYPAASKSATIPCIQLDTGEWVPVTRLPDSPAKKPSYTLDDII